jgi:hypothetical protein
MPFVRNPESFYGPDAAIVRGELTPDDCRAIEAAGLHHVVIGSTSDISNLSRIRGLTKLDVLAVDPVDLGPVSTLVSLRHLTVGGNWHGEISLAALPHLEVFGGDMKRPRASISGVLPESKLRFVQGNFDEKMITALSRCEALQTLAVHDIRIKDLDWLEGAAQQIRALSFTKCTVLADVGGLRHVPGLKFLKFERCRKLGRLDAIEVLASLELLQLDDCGDIDSLDPLQRCNALRLLTLNGDTRVLDGRISVLAPRADALSVRFVDRPTYDRAAATFAFDDAFFASAHAAYMN